MEGRSYRDTDEALVPPIVSSHIMFHVSLLASLKERKDREEVS